MSASGRLSPVMGMLIPLLALAAAAAPPAGEQPRLVEVTPRVWAVLQPSEGRFNDSNSVFIRRDDHLVAVDSQNTSASTKKTIALVRERTSLPVRYLVNTHWHGDHVQGNSAWSEAYPGVEFIAHESVPSDIVSRGDPQRADQLAAWREAIAAAEARTALPPGREEAPSAEERGRLEQRLPVWRERLAELETIRIVLPTLLVSDEIRWAGDDLPVRVMHAPGHTDGDLIVFLPEEKVLVTGDLVDDLPFGGHGSPRQWLETLRELEALEFDWMVPGHGSIRRGPEHLILIRRLVEAIVQQVDEAVAAGLDLEATQARLELEEFRAALAGEDELARRAFDDFVPATIEQAYHERRKR